MAKRDFKKRIQPLVEYYKNCEDKTVGIGGIKQKEACGGLISELRRNYKEGKLYKDEIELLELMGMRWHISFADNIKILKVWCTKNHCDLSKATQYSKLEINIDGKIEAYDVGGVLGEFRQMMRDGLLSENQASILDMLGIVWSPRQVNVVYAHLIKYAEENGSISDLQSRFMYEYNGEIKDIGRQASRLRHKYADGSLDEATIATFRPYGLWDGLEIECKITQNNSKYFDIPEAINKI